MTEKRGGGIGRIGLSGAGARNLVIARNVPPLAQPAKRLSRTTSASLGDVSRVTALPWTRSELVPLVAQPSRQRGSAVRRIKGESQQLRRHPPDQIDVVLATASSRLRKRQDGGHVRVAVGDVGARVRGQVERLFD